MSPTYNFHSEYKWFRIFFTWKIYWVSVALKSRSLEKLKINLDALLDNKNADVNRNTEANKK